MQVNKRTFFPCYDVIKLKAQLLFLLLSKHQMFDAPVKPFFKSEHNQLRILDFTTISGYSTF